MEESKAGQCRNNVEESGNGCIRSLNYRLQDPIMKTTVVIPARAQSERLPNKLLAEVDGRPVLQHAWESAANAKVVNAVFIATDSDEIAAAAANWGAAVIRTGACYGNGTERIASIADRLDCDLIINVQGDQVGLRAGILSRLAEVWTDKMESVITPVFAITDPDDLQDPNLVKVVTGPSGRAIYFSRFAVPFVPGTIVKEWNDPVRHYGHLGIYGLSPATLKAYAQLPPSKNEITESLEQLRFIDNGIPIQTFEIANRPLSIDCAKDLELARESMEIEVTSIVPVAPITT